MDVVVKCVQCIQWTSVSHRAMAAEMTHVCQTDFLLLHIIVVQRDVQVSAEKHVSKDIPYLSPRHRNPSMLSGGNSNIFIMSVYESKTKPTMLKYVSL